MRSYHLEAFGHVDGIVPREHDVPAPEPTEILVRVRAVSLNKRDVYILHQLYPLPSTPGVIPISDGAGEVVAVGDEVTRFEVGDRVIGSYWPRWRDGRLAPDLYYQLGCNVDGMLTEHALLDEQWAVHAPSHLSWEEAATLPCAGLTAWSSVRDALPGQTVLTLGTGGVSLFALQFAKLHGCRVISTTSSSSKAARLEALGADAVVDYVKTPEWGEAVQALTDGNGADLVVETHGPDTIEQSLRATGLYGHIVLLITGSAQRSSIEISNEAYRSSMATIRRIFVGSRADLEAMNRAVSGHGMRPVVDHVFGFDEVGPAFEHFLSGRAFGKVVIRVA